MFFHVCVKYTPNISSDNFFLFRSAVSVPGTLNNRDLNHTQASHHTLQQSKSSGNILHPLQHSKSSGNVLHTLQQSCSSGSILQVRWTWLSHYTTERSDHLSQLRVLLLVCPHCITGNWWEWQWNSIYQ